MITHLGKSANLQPFEESQGRKLFPPIWQWLLLYNPPEMHLPYTINKAQFYLRNLLFSSVLASASFLWVLFALSLTALPAAVVIVTLLWTILIPVAVVVTPLLRTVPVSAVVGLPVVAVVPFGLSGPLLGFSRGPEVW